jgi:hypothetical protein
MRSDLKFLGGRECESLIDISQGFVSERHFLSYSFYILLTDVKHMMKVKNTTNRKKAIYVVTRELVILDPGEEIEFDGDIELVEDDS